MDNATGDRTSKCALKTRTGKCAMSRSTLTESQFNLLHRPLIVQRGADQRSLFNLVKKDNLRLRICRLERTEEKNSDREGEGK